MGEERIKSRVIASKVTSADEAAELIPARRHGGYERVHRCRVSQGRAGRAGAPDRRRIARAGSRFTVSVWTGASTAPELDGALASVDGIDLRMPYQSDPVTRAKINAGVMDYIDLHLSPRRADGVGRIPRASGRGAGRGRRHHRGRGADPLDSRSATTRPGSTGPTGSSSRSTRGRPPGWRACTTSTTAPRCRRTACRCRSCTQPTASASRTCAARRTRSLRWCATDAPDRNTPFKPADGRCPADRRAPPRVSRPRGAAAADCPATLLPLQSGVGNIANAVLAGLDDGPFRPLTAYTEVIQDGMLHLLRSGTLAAASATALSLSPSRNGRPDRQPRLPTASGSCCGRRRSATIPR